MQNPEEDILQRFLQDTFSDYEPMPTEQSWEQIHKAIHPQKPSVGSSVKQWIVPVVGLLLLIGGVVWNTNQASSGELEDNSIALLTKPEGENWSVKPNATAVKKWSVETQTTAMDELKDNTKKLLVNETTSNEEGELPTVAKKQSEVFEKNTSDEIATNIITTEETKNVLLVSLDEKSSLSINKIEGLEEKKEIFTPVVGVLTDHSSEFVSNAVRVKPTVELPATSVDRTKDSFVKTYTISENTPLSVEEGLGRPTLRVRLYTPINNAIITEVRYVKPIETLKNKDFVLSKPQFESAKINQISIAKEAKPIRRPTYLSLSIMPLQTYRILTVNRRDIQNLQTNNLFDSERNGFALELGIVKPIANSWNLRSSLSYLKMRQWAEYQIATDIVSVKNSSSYSNNNAIATNDNEFIAQTRAENKTLQMVGLKADVQKFFKLSGRNRYFISTGTQLMYETNEKQTNVFINASAGFQHVVNKDLFLTVEPTASYLLYNINDSKSLIQTNAYNLGLKIGVNFRVK
jgi:hypothetical protein